MATSQQDVDWQSTKKTVLERSRHMFNNPFMSDVKFSCEGSDKKVFAHKYVLATSSAVFYAMFYGELAEKNSVVHLSDTNEEGLQEFLRFLYTDECNLTTDNAVFVLYLAKKYIMPSLAQQCIEFLEAYLGVENAITVVQQAIQFDEKKLEKKCWDLIDLKTSEAIASDAFTDINQATLAELLKRELNVKELDLFKAVLKWSEAECSRKGIEANPKNKRAAMGNTIYQIRFGSMTPQEFAQNASQSGILTPEEMVLFYDNIGGLERASEEWNLSKRRVRHMKSSTSEPDLREEVLLRCCRFGDHGKEYDVKLEVFSQLVEKKCLSQLNSRGISGFDVMLPVPIEVQADVLVHLKATITGPGNCFYGYEGKKKVETNGITVNFFNTPDEHSGETFVEEGQFYEIIFSKIIT